MPGPSTAKEAVAKEAVRTSTRIAATKEQTLPPPESPASAAGIKPASKAGFYRKQAEEAEARLAASQRELAELRRMAEVEEAQEAARREAEATTKEEPTDAGLQVPLSAAQELQAEVVTLRAQRDGLAAQLREAVRLTEDSLQAKASEVQRQKNTIASLTLDLGTARHERDAAQFKLAAREEEIRLLRAELAMRGPNDEGNGHNATQAVRAGKTTAIPLRLDLAPVRMCRVNRDPSQLSSAPHCD